MLDELNGDIILWDQLQTYGLWMVAEQSETAAHMLSKTTLARCVFGGCPGQPTVR